MDCYMSSYRSHTSIAIPRVQVFRERNALDNLPNAISGGHFLNPGPIGTMVRS